MFNRFIFPAPLPPSLKAHSKLVTYGYYLCTRQCDVYRLIGFLQGKIPVYTNSRRCGIIRRDVCKGKQYSIYGYGRTLDRRRANKRNGRFNFRVQHRRQQLFQTERHRKSCGLRYDMECDDEHHHDQYNDGIQLRNNMQKTRDA